MKDAEKVSGGRTVAHSAVITPAAGPVSRAVLRWYDRVGRDLPWRRSQDPYAVWVSEIMLQQTQVERVKDFFARFVGRFPDVATLAAATEEEVLALWEGLGYYRRARQMHAAARAIVAEHGGLFPPTVAGLRGLPGIGRYTAGAIASIAFGLREPIIEANSRRVTARLVGYAAPIDGTRGEEPLWQVAAALVPRRHPGRFNQALMDLGALVCTPVAPLCGTCPIAAWCVARESGQAASIPVRGRRPRLKRLRETAVVARRGGRVLLVKRGPGEWWEGLWDFPRAPGDARRAVRGLAAAPFLRGLACGPARSIGRLVHTVTCHRITLDVVACVAQRGGTPVRGRRWVPVSRLEGLAMSAPARRITKLIA